MKKAIHIGKSTIGLDFPTYFIADIAANHDGSLERAKELIHRAADAGADAAKFQNFHAKTIVSDFGFKNLGSRQSHQEKWKKSVFEVYKDAELPVDWTGELKETCRAAGIDYFTAPYDLAIIETLLPHVAAWKVGSGDITWLDMIETLARTNRALLIATGAATLDEVREAYAVAARHTAEICLMQCNTNYTGSIENMKHVNLRVLQTYSREFPDVVLGLSDHTPGHATVLGAVTLGARAIEKHFTDDTTRTGPDHGFSMDPGSWRAMVDRTRELEASLGDDIKRVMDNEQQTVVVQRRALRAARPLPQGTVITPEDLAPLRPCPADGVAPSRVHLLVGQKTTRDVVEGDVVRLIDVA